MYILLILSTVISSLMETCLIEIDSLSVNKSIKELGRQANLHLCLFIELDVIEEY